MQIVVNGLLTRYQRHGTGKNLLFIHGWADQLETFEGLIKELSGSYECIMLDLPGFGQTEAPKASWKLDDYAEFIDAFVKKLRLNHIYAVVGHSNGGAVAIKAVSGNLLKPDKLILLAASGVRKRGGVRRHAVKLVAKTGKVMTLWLPKTTRQSLQKKLYGTIGSDMLVAPHMKETFKQTVRQDIVAEAGRIAIPTLLIYGDMDRATPIQSVGLILHNAVPKSELKIMHGGDHFVHQTHAAQVTKLIREFLAA